MTKQGPPVRARATSRRAAADKAPAFATAEAAPLARGEATPAVKPAAKVAPAAIQAEAHPAQQPRVVVGAADETVDLRRRSIAAVARSLQRPPPGRP